MKLKKNLVSIITVLAFCSFFPVASMGLTIDLNTVFPGDPAPDGTSPWLRATFTDATVNNVAGVQLTLEAIGLASPNFVDASGLGEMGWYFNINPAYDNQLSNLKIDYISGSNTSPVIGLPPASNPNYPNGGTPDAFKADGDGSFDFAFAFPQGDNFLPGYADTFFISGMAGLTAADFDSYSLEGGGQGTYRSAAHIQSLSAPLGGSTWVGDGDGPSGKIPEPTSLVLLGSGLIGASLVVRKRTRGISGTILNNH